MPKITFCGLLFQLHIKWETSYYWYHSCFLWRHIDVCFLSSKYSHGSVGTGGLCCGSHIFDWHPTGSRRPDPQNGQHPPDEISGAETEIQICAAGKDLLQWDSNLFCLWFFLSAEWQLAEDSLGLQSYFFPTESSVSLGFLCFSPAFSLWTRHFLLMCAGVEFPSKVECRQAIKFWMLMWWSLARGPHTGAQTKRNTHLLERCSVLGCL